MIPLLIVVGWLALSSLVAPHAVREVSNSWRRCHARSSSVFKSICQDYDPPDCWRSDGEITPGTFAAGLALAVVWPLALWGYAIWQKADSLPSARDLRNQQAALADRETHVARLERELGIGGDR